MSMNSTFTIRSAIADANLGAAAAADGNLALVGAPSGAGQAQLVRLDTGETSHLLVSPEPSPNAHFGSAVAMQPVGARNHYLVVGASGVSNDQGAAFIFFMLHADAPPRFTLKLTASDAAAEQFFGSAAAMHGGRVVIGARGRPFGFGANGAAYVFDVVTGVQLAKLTPRQRDGTLPVASCFWFGASLAITSDVVLVGAPKARSPCARSSLAGAAFLYEQRHNYRQGALIMPEDYRQGAMFGSSVAIHNRVDGSGSSVLIIGAPQHSTQGRVYTIGPFDLRNLPTAFNAVAAGDRDQYYSSRDGPLSLVVQGRSSMYGQSIAIEATSGLALIGSPNAFTQFGPQTGAVTLTREWMSVDLLGHIQPVELRSPSTKTQPGDQFGSTLAITATGIAVIVAPQRSEAYIIHPPELSPPPSWPYPPSSPPPNLPLQAPNITYDPPPPHHPMEFTSLSASPHLHSAVVPSAYSCGWRGRSGGARSVSQGYVTLRTLGQSSWASKSIRKSRPYSRRGRAWR